MTADPRDCYHCGPEEIARGRCRCIAEKYHQFEFDRFDSEEERAEQDEREKRWYQNLCWRLKP